MCEGRNRFHQLSCMSVPAHELIMQSAAFQTHASRCTLQLLRWCHRFQNGFLWSVARCCVVKWNASIWWTLEVGVLLGHLKPMPHISENKTRAPQTRGQLTTTVFVIIKNILGSSWRYGGLTHSWQFMENTAEFIAHLGRIDYSWYEYCELPNGNTDSSMIYLTLQPIVISHTGMWRYKVPWFIYCVPSYMVAVIKDLKLRGVPAKNISN